MEKKHILLLTTGGTIASLPGGEGLEPHRSDVMERQLEQLRSYFHITVEDLMCLDSSNIRPAEWQQIATRVFAAVLEDAGVYKNTPEGMAAFERFAAHLNQEV